MVKRIIDPKEYVPTIIKTPGWQDWHNHGDRAFTFHDKYFEHEGGLNEYIDAGLDVKQSAMGVLHRGYAYSEESLYERMRRVIDAKVAAGEVMVNLITDCSPEIEGRAFNVALRLREEYKDLITINVGAYAIFGFERFGSEYEKHLEELAPRAQFLVGLPERDDKPHHPVGYVGHLAILIDMAKKGRIPLHVHVDQTGAPDEGGLETFINAVRFLLARTPPEERPSMYAVHGLSTRSQDEPTFWRNMARMKKHGIKLVVCPHATLGNRQLPSILAPMRNSIARVKEAVLAGIGVHFGTDNINDLFMPTPTSPLLAREIGSEFGMGQDAIRFYDMTVLDKLARGVKLNKTDIARVERSLKGDYTATGWFGQRPWRHLEDFLKPEDK